MTMATRDRSPQEDPQSPLFDPLRLPNDWQYTIDDQLLILRTKFLGGITWVWSPDYKEWQEIPPTHQTQFDFADMFYTAVRPTTHTICRSGT